MGLVISNVPETRKLNMNMVYEISSKNKKHKSFHHLEMSRPLLQMWRNHEHDQYQFLHLCEGISLLCSKYLLEQIP